MGGNSRTNGLCYRMNRFLWARPGHADGLRECCNRHVRPDAVGAANLPELRQAADDAVRMRDARREIRVKAMPAEHLQESVVDALQQSLGPVVCLDRLLQHVDEVHAVARIDEIRRAMAEEIRITEAAQLLRRDVIQVDVETGSRLHQSLQRIRVVVGRRVDVGIPASTCIQQHVHHIIIAAHAVPLLGLRVHGAELEIRLVFNVAENLVVKTARRDRRIPRLQIFRLPLCILPRVTDRSSHRLTPIWILIRPYKKACPYRTDLDFVSIKSCRSPTNPSVLIDRAMVGEPGPFARADAPGPASRDIFFLAALVFWFYICYNDRRHPQLFYRKFRFR